MDARTTLIGLFGHPVAHSLSPLFMNAALKSLGLNAAYLAFDVGRERLEQAVSAISALGWKGANVTVPHKEAALGRVDAVDPDARAVGALNCIVNDDGALRGHNTDHLGFVEALREGGHTQAGAGAVLIGCGGAARAVLYGLVREGVRNVYLFNRTRARAEAFIEWSVRTLGFDGIVYAGARLGGDEERGEAESEPLKEETAGARLFVNTTPLGMHPRVGETPLGPGFSFPRGALAFDLIYNPPATEFLRRAERDGARTLNGLPMLILQGLHSLALWFPDRSGEIFTLAGRLRRAANRALGGGG